MSVADRLGMGPRRETQSLADGFYRVFVTPPDFLDLPTQSVILNEAQYRLYLAWLSGDVYVQEIEGLSASEREVLVTGIGPDEWDEMFKEETDR